MSKSSRAFHIRRDLFAKMEEDAPRINLDNDTLLQNYSDAKAATEAWLNTLHSHESEILRRLEQDGATELVTGCHTATLSPGRAEVDPARIEGILELLSEEELIGLGAYSLERLVKTPATWHLRELQKLRKRGTEYTDIIDAATIRGRPKLIVTSNVEPKN